MVDDQNAEENPNIPQPVTPHHRYAPVNAVGAANAPEEADEAKFATDEERNLPLYFGSALVIFGALFGVVLGNTILKILVETQ